MKKIFIAIIIIIVALGIALFFMNKNKSYNDGIFKSSASGAFGDINIKLEIKDGKILKCELEAIDKEGNIKNENYGKNSGEKNYQLAQIALNGIMKYPDMLLQAQDVEKIDAISGATVSFREFQMAVKDALEKSRNAKKLF